jgi:hypothetical protein
VYSIFLENIIRRQDEIENKMGLYFSKEISKSKVSKSEKHQR